MTNRPNKKTTTSQSFWFRFKGVEWLFMNLPYVCFCALIGVVYIYNAHQVEKKVRKIDALKTEVNDLRWRYMDVQKEIMYGSTQSQIQRRVEEDELQPVDNLPVVIRVEKGE